MPWRATAPDSTRQHEAETRGLVSGLTLQKSAKLESFEETILPHLDAAYNLARWMLRNDQDAQDVVQEALCGPTGSLTVIEGEIRRHGCWPLSGIRP